jgi:hypothetical protein
MASAPPINYTAGLAQLDASPLVQALGIRRQNQAQKAESQARAQQAQLARDKFVYDQQKDADYQEAVKAYQANPTPQALRDLGMQFPEQSERLVKAGDSYTTAAKQDLVGAGFSALGAIAAGNTPLAIDTLQRRRDGLANSGVDTSHTDAAIQMLKDGKSKEATAYLSYAMSGLVGADHAASILDQLGYGAKAEDRRADNERQAAGQAETARHNRVEEGQGAARVQLSREAGARAAKNGGGRSKKAPYSDAQLDALIQ